MTDTPDTSPSFPAPLPDRMVSAQSYPCQSESCAEVIAALEDKNTKLSEQYEDLKKTGERDANQKSNKIETLEIHIQNYENGLFEASKDNKHLESRCEAAQRKLAEEESHWTKERAHLGDTIEERLREIEQLSRENEQLSRDREQLSRDREQLLREMKQLLQENEQLLQENEQLLQEKEQLLEEKEQLLEARKELLHDRQRRRSSSHSRIGGESMQIGCISDRKSPKTPVQSLEEELAGYMSLDYATSPAEKQGGGTADEARSFIHEVVFNPSIYIKLTEATELSRQNTLVNVEAFVVHDSVEELAGKSGSQLRLMNGNTRSKPFVSVRIWRSHIEALPESSEGEQVWLEGFAVCLGNRGIPYLDSRDGSAWCVRSRRSPGKLLRYKNPAPMAAHIVERGD